MTPGIASVSLQAASASLLIFSQTSGKLLKLELLPLSCPGPCAWLPCGRPTLVPAFRLAGHPDQVRGTSQHRARLPPRTCLCHPPAPSAFAIPLAQTKSAHCPSHADSHFLRDFSSPHPSPHSRNFLFIQEHCHRSAPRCSQLFQLL